MVGIDKGLFSQVRGGIEGILAQAPQTHFARRLAVLSRGCDAAWRQRVDHQHCIPALERSLRPHIEDMRPQVPSTGRKHDKGWKWTGTLRLEHLARLGVGERL